MTTSLAEYYRGSEAAAAALASAPPTAGARATAVHAALQPLLDAASDAPRACRAGCAHCCHFPVGVTFAEACRLADAVAGAADLQGTLRAQALATAPLPWSALVGRPCPLLRPDGGCGAYAARPLPCRALASASAEACAAALHGAGDVPRDEAAYWRGLGAAATLAADAPSGSRELRSAVAAVLAAGVEPEARGEAFCSARPVP